MTYKQVYRASDLQIGISSLRARCLSRRGRDHMVVRFTTIYAISAYHHYHCELESRSCEVYSIQWPAAGRSFSPGTPVSSNKTDLNDIWLKVALNTITLTPYLYNIHFMFQPKKIFVLVISEEKKLTISETRIVHDGHACFCRIQDDWGIFAEVLSI